MYCTSGNILSLSVSLSSTRTFICFTVSILILVCIVYIVVVVYLFVCRAMKRDVTMFGRRTRHGTMDDGFTFAKRYYINNYKDERKLQGLQLITGAIKYSELPQFKTSSGTAERLASGIYHTDM